MTEKAEKFLAAVSADAALKDELKQRLEAAAPEKRDDVTLAFAKEKGYALTAEDLRPDIRELDQDELSEVAGGGTISPGRCVCPLAGSGTGHKLKCTCVIYGSGDCPIDKGYCTCVFGGYGATLF